MSHVLETASIPLCDALSDKIHKSVQQQHSLSLHGNPDLLPDVEVLTPDEPFDTQLGPYTCERDSAPTHEVKMIMMHIISSYQILVLRCCGTCPSPFLAARRIRLR